MTESADLIVCPISRALLLVPYIYKSPTVPIHFLFFLFFIFFLISSDFFLNFASLFNRVLFPSPPTTVNKLLSLSGSAVTPAVKF